mgnify:CR=1 FL=1|jgi:hypothetical protein
MFTSESVKSRRDSCGALETNRNRPIKPDSCPFNGISSHHPGANIRAFVLFFPMVVPVFLTLSKARADIAKLEFDEIFDLF